MSVLLFVVGAIVTMMGVGMVGYGIPINEFSFGNTLIVAGTTAVVGGLIIIAIGAAVGQLQRIAETLATHMPVRPGRPVEMVDRRPARRGPDAGPIPFPPKPKSEPAVPEPQPPAETAVEDHPAVAAAPTLQNPDRPAAAVEEFEVEEYEDVSLSPRQAVPAPAPLAEPAPVAGQRRCFSGGRNAPGAGLRCALAFFAAAATAAGAPISAKLFRCHVAGGTPGRRNARSSTRPSPSRSRDCGAGAPMPAAPSEPVAILKSGVVDGMGYTLYVDGSIEAELPQGTLHFASINELRNHLAKNS